MFRAITIQGLGLDETLALSVKQPTNISRRSMRGKTRLARGLMLLLTGREPWGSSPEPRNDKPITITANTRTMVLERTIKRDKRGNLQHRRKLEIDGAEVNVSSERKWQAALNDIGPSYGDPDVIRLVCWPLAWQRLEASDKDGRALRDALLGCLDTAAAMAKIVKASSVYKDGDPLDEKGATEARRLARKNAQTAEGRVREAEASAERLEPVQAPEEADVEKARAMMKRRADWDAFETYLSAYEAWVDWHERRERLGERPSPLADGVLEDARERADKARKARDEEWQQVDGGEGLVREARRMLETAERDLAAHVKPTDSTTCPECNHEWIQGFDEEAWDQAHAALAETKERRQATLDDATKALEAARGASTIAEIEHDNAAEALEDLQAQSAAYVAWAERLAMMGQEPQEPSPSVQQPQGVPPTPIDVAAAQGVIEQAQRAEGAGQLRDEDRQRAAKALDAARAKLKAAAAEADRLDKLVEVIREAPAQLLPYAVEALEDTGPAKVVASGAGVTVHINGHPWQEASQGELIHADLYLRAAIRRAYGVRWLPLIVEQAQDWSEDWGDVQAPAYMLWTERSQ